MDLPFARARAVRVRFSSAAAGCSVPSALLAVAALFCAVPAFAGITATVTADNAYGIGIGDADGIDAAGYFGPFINTTASEISSCATGVEQHTFTSVDSGEYLYIAAWSDNGSRQGLIGQFQSADAPIAYTGAGSWQVCATGIDYDWTAPPLDGPSGSAAINAQIAVCNAGTGSPSTTSAGWVGLTGGGNAGNLYFGEDNTSGGHYGAISCMDTGARWMWFNSSPSTISDPIGTSPPGSHKEYLLFRLPLGEILGTCNSAVDCSDGNACTFDSCDATSGTCSNESYACEDDNACTSDSCDPAHGCVFAPTPPCTAPGFEKCQRAIVGGVVRAATAEAKARAKCEDRRLTAPALESLDCANDADTQESIDKALAKLDDSVGAHCGDPSQFGWPAMCPDFAGLGCGSIAIGDADGLTACMTCLQHAVVDQMISLPFATPASSAVSSGCQRAIGKATTRWFASRLKSHAKCTLGRLEGRHEAACPTPGDGRSAKRELAAQDRLIDRISSACGAWQPSDGGFPSLCPAVGNCGGTVGNMMELIDCAICAPAFLTDCTVSGAILPREDFPLACEKPIGPCDDGLFCTLDEMIEYIEESETSALCYGGSNDGLACDNSADCPNGTCGPVPLTTTVQCTGGFNDSQPCANNADCPAGFCETIEAPPCCQAGVCAFGEEGVACTTNADCGCGGPLLQTVTECTHTTLSGAQFGDWLWICDSGGRKDRPCTTSTDCPDGTCINASPCCEDDADCEFPEPDPDAPTPQPDLCMIGTCIESTHRCFFQEAHPSECSDEDIPPAEVPTDVDPCVEPAAAGVLCNLSVATDPVPDVPLEINPAHPRPFLADIHVHMFAEESWVARTFPHSHVWRWVHDSVGSVGDQQSSCDGGGDHGRVRTIKPILRKLEECESELAFQSWQTFLGATLCEGVPGLCNFVVPLAGPEALSEQFSKTEGTRGDAGYHWQRRHPPTGWTRWDTIAHHMVRADELKKAKNRGLRLIVVELTGTRGLCELLPPSGLGAFLEEDTCNEMDAVDRQIKLAEKFVQSNSWARIVTTPAEAIDAINESKLAIVLSIETSELFRNIEDTLKDGTAAARRTAIRGQLDKYFGRGVRSLHIAHLTDSLFAGAAESNFAGGILQFMHDPDGDDCPHSKTDEGGFKLGFDMKYEWDNWANGFIHKNNLGLNDAGAILIEEMMDLGMLIDVQHSSEAAIQEVWEILWAGLPAKPGRTNAGPYYPFQLSHTRFREIVKPKDATEYTLPPWITQRVTRTGGIVGLRTNGDEMRTYEKDPIVANVCAGSSRSFAQMLRYGIEGLKVPTALGTDLMTWSQFTRPRFRDNSLPGRTRRNRNGACAAGFPAEGVCQARKQEEQGTNDESFDTKGLASIDQDIDLIEDLAEVGVPEATLDRLRNSAVDFIRMWIRATTERHGPAALANVGPGPNDMDLTGIAWYQSVKTRKKQPPFEMHEPCFRRYCPRTQEMGEECLFDKECKDDLLCGGANLCGRNYGVCVCTIDGGCDSDHWCRLGVPGAAFDNKCEGKKGFGGDCHADRQCKSGECRWWNCTDPD